VNKKNLLIISFSAFVLYFFFISGRRVPDPSEEEIFEFVADPSLYHNVDEIYRQNLQKELDVQFRDLNRKGVFNGTLLYAENGRVVFEGAYGYADFSTKDSLTLQSQFQLASVSKMFTAAAIMILQQEGLLDYDDTLTRFIPEFPYADITIRQLLTHRSGLSRYMHLADQYWNMKEPISNEEVIGLYVKHKPEPYFRPDKGFYYCNANYALLASVVERVSEMHFDEYLKEKIFDPLGMNHSFVYNLRNDSVIGRSIAVGVQGHERGGRHFRKVPDHYLNGVMGDKGMYSTVGDMFLFNTALDNGTLIALENLNEAFKPGSPDYRYRKDNYGFGWRLKEDLDSTAYHFGWWKGFRTYYMRDMQNDRVLIALTNTSKGISSTVLWDIIRNATRTEDVLAVYSELDE
jgi:CubicO group peptidase (beta-lactamase class C family)